MSVARPDLAEALGLAVVHGASDVIVTRGAPISYKVHGRLVHVNAEPLSAEQARDLVFAILARDQIGRLERDRELDFSFELRRPTAQAPGAVLDWAGGGAGPPEPPARFRASVFYQRASVAAVFRLIPRDVPTLAQLGLPPIVEEFALAPEGLFLVTGPTGVGKTTTLAAMVDTINRARPAHVITIEDPIEYVHRNRLAVIEQREVGDDTLSFAKALRHALRQAPDVITIGEMRDLETMSAALTAAETGHLVLATIHTIDVVKTIDRIIDTYPPHQQNQARTQLALALKGVLSQRLIPTADGRGRVLAVELLVNTTAVANLIREQKLHQLYSVIETSSREGMIAMDASLKRLQHEGRITAAEARARMRNPAPLAGPGGPGSSGGSVGESSGAFRRK